MLTRTDVAILALAFAAANRHPDPEAYAHKVVDAFDNLTEQPSATAEEPTQNDAAAESQAANEQPPTATGEQTSAEPPQPAQPPQPDPQQ